MSIENWETSGEYAQLIAIPRKWWSIKHWILVNKFLRECGVVIGGRR